MSGSLVGCPAFDMHTGFAARVSCPTDGSRENRRFPALQVATLTDRVRACECKPQIYGTVLDWDKNGELSCDVEDQANLDARRRQVGLPAFAVDLASHLKEVAAEGGNPPRDFDEAKRRRLEWSKRVGWID
jgi:hypothetical protein